MKGNRMSWIKTIAALTSLMIAALAAAQGDPANTVVTSAEPTIQEIADPDQIDAYGKMANMFRIPGGKVPQTSRHDLSSGDTSLAQQVCAPFYIDKFEVTNRQFAEFLTRIDSAEKYYDPRMEIVKVDGNEYVAARDRSDYPATYVDWFGAFAFARWAGKSLPTVEEWILAGLGNQVVPESESIFPWGTDRVDSTKANLLDPTTFPGPKAVGSFPEGSSPYGVLDMAGNVAEWTVTKMAPNSADSASFRLIAVKGGSFLDPEENLTVFSQTFRDPNERLSSLGFRCIKREQ
jgi:formylglycine-generating enzyme required for sulfatase activity